MLKKLFFTLTALVLSTQLYAQTTIVTFNLANYNDHGNWTKRVDLIVDAIREANADVVVLQETRFDPDEPNTKASYLNMAEQVLKKLNDQNDFIGASVVTQPAMFYPNNEQYPSPASKSKDGKSHVSEGLSIISKRKIIETGGAFLSQAKSCTDTNKRVTQYIKIENDDAPLYLFNAHFAFIQQCISDNIKETLQYMQKIAGENPTMIMGDFNTTPDESAFTYLREVGLVDVWGKLRVGEAGKTFPAGQASKRIDYIWADKNIADKLTAKEQIWMIGTTPQEGEYPSDHYGLALRF